jgi:hypothetical protein
VPSGTRSHTSMSGRQQCAEKKLATCSHAAPAGVLASVASTTPGGAAAATAHPRSRHGICVAVLERFDQFILVQPISNQQEIL